MVYICVCISSMILHSYATIIIHVSTIFLSVWCSIFWLVHSTMCALYYTPTLGICYIHKVWLVLVCCLYMFMKNEIGYQSEVIKPNNPIVFVSNSSRMRRGNATTTTWYNAPKVCEELLLISGVLPFKRSIEHTHRYTV